MNPPRAAFYTLGCKLNQLETESIADSFREAGFELGSIEFPSDIVVLNTCTVTSKAEQKARRMIRKLLKEDPKLKVIVTGCYAELEAAELSGLDERVIVLPGSRKSELLSFAGHLAKSFDSRGEILSVFSGTGDSGGDRAGYPPGKGTRDEFASRFGKFAFNSGNFFFHSRASVKIQDGCDNSCSYCRVRFARGKSVSLDPEKVVERVRALESRGYREATLTGVNISQYRSGGLDFSGLLELLIDTTENMRFRVSSFEPDLVDGRFAAAVSHGRVRPHFHLPLQSGSSGILRAMRRRYAPQCVIEACARLRKAKEDPFIAADVIVGFPGETEKDFLDTRMLCKDLGFAWIHVFPFSPRPGTEAASLKPHIPERIAVERLAELTELAKMGKAAYVDRWIGRSVEAIVESSFDDGSGDSLATTENYLKVRIHGLDAEKSGKGACVNCRIMEKGEKDFDAIAVPSS